MARGFIRTYRTYSYIDKNPVIDKVRTLIGDEGLMKELKIVHEISGVSTSTLDNWFNGTTRSPQHATIAAVITSLGYEETFQKKREIDVEKERKIAADWLEKQEKKGAIKKERAKTNGHRQTQGEEIMKRKPKVGHSVSVNANIRSVTAVDRTIGTRLRARRLEMGISQDALASGLGLSFQQIQKYEKGTNRIGSARLVQLAHMLQVDTSYFLGGLNGDRKALATASQFADFMATKDGVEINEAMMKLDDGNRRGVIDLARALVRAYAR